MLDIPRTECKILNMDEKAINIDRYPQLRSPVLVAGFEGWGNALDVSKTMVNYLIRNLDAQPFARVNGDLFYRFDESRPWVDIEGGYLKTIEAPGGTLYSVQIKDSERDLILLRASEPHLRWYTFVDGILSLCKRLNTSTIITLGSMYDNVLHSDVVISGIASSSELVARLESKNVIPITYQGPTAIHSVFHSKGQEMGFECISLWCHCPYYLQGATHYGLIAALGDIVASFCQFKLDTTELDLSWKELNRQIQELVEKNPDLQKMIDGLRKAKVKGSWESIKASVKRDDKVIHIEDFLRPK